MRRPPSLEPLKRQEIICLGLTTAIKRGRVEKQFANPEVGKGDDQVAEKPKSEIENLKSKMFG
jgi:hypothetical protein